MEPFIADLINDPKTPKFIRYGIVTVLCLFIIFLGVNCTVSSPFLLGKIFGILLAVGGTMSGIYLMRKIYKNSKINNLEDKDHGSKI